MYNTCVKNDIFIFLERIVIKEETMQKYLFM